MDRLTANMHGGFSVSSSALQSPFDILRFSDLILAMLFMADRICNIAPLVRPMMFMYFLQSLVNRQIYNLTIFLSVLRKSVVSLCNDFLIISSVCLWPGICGPSLYFASISWRSFSFHIWQCRKYVRAYKCHLINFLEYRRIINTKKSQV